MRHTEAFIAALNAIEVEGTVLERLRAVLTGLEASGLDLPFAFFYEWLGAWS